MSDETSLIGGLSDKQARWIVGAALATRADIPGIALLLAIARRAGPELSPFAASDEELAAEATHLLDTASAAFLRQIGGLQ